MRVCQCSRALSQNTRAWPNTFSSCFEVHRGALARCHQPCPVLAANRQMRRMSDNRREQHSGTWLGLVLRDVQFWVPVAVLLGGLLVLRWIS